MYKRLTALLICLLLLGGCGSAAPDTPPAPVLHPYDSISFALADDRMTYSGAYETGIDVSAHQGEIDWEKVAADGIDFAMIRLGYRGRETGLLNLDKYFVKNIKGATANGIKVGVYFYSQAVTRAEAEEEAAFVLKHAGRYDITYPVVYDLEKDAAPDARANGLTADQRTEFALAFCNAVKLGGCTPAVYGSASFLQSGFDLLLIQQYDTWLAHYTDSLSFEYDFTIWQYSKKGRVNGIGTRVDMNICPTPYY